MAGSWRAVRHPTSGPSRITTSRTPTDREARRTAGRSPHFAPARRLPPVEGRIPRGAGGRPWPGRRHPAPPRTVPSSPRGPAPPKTAGSARPWQGCCPNGRRARPDEASLHARRTEPVRNARGRRCGAGGWPGRVRSRQRFVSERRRAARRALGSGRAPPSGRHSSPSGSEAASARARLQSASWYLRLGIATKFRASSSSIRCCGVGLNRCSLSSPSKK